MDFKEILKQDVCNVFLNTKEFAQLHILEGQEIPMVVDDNEFVEMQLKAADGQRVSNAMFKSGKVIYVASDDFGKPKPGSRLTLDKQNYIVCSAENQGSIRRIVLEKAGGR
jgi:hypothetical protein|nr:MAG TPA: ATP-binding sugar transporter [Caudoviricetes sp.]